jgi:type VI secretion system protein VasD
MTDKALETVGLKKPALPETPDMPAVPDSALPDWRVNWRIFASDSLNVDDNGQSLALLVRIYKLKSPDAFLQAPYGTFGDADKEKAALNDDLIATRELQLLPGQRHEAIDKVAREAPYIGIVALYRNPSANRWRHAFSTTSAARSGLHLGMHACAMSVQLGDAIGASPGSASSVAAPCP